MGVVNMTGQYGLTKEEIKFMKEMVERYIHTYDGDLFSDHEITIHLNDDKENESFISID